MKKEMILKYSAFTNAIEHIQSTHPLWTISIDKMFKVFNGTFLPKDYYEDYVPYALIRSENREWRAWLVPSIEKNINDYIPPEYQNVLHIHAPLNLSRPLEELIGSEDGIKEYIKKTKRDILCRLPNSFGFESNTDELVRFLEKIPCFDVFHQLSERIEVIDDDLRDIQFYIKNLPQTRNTRKHILQLLLIVVDCIGKIVQTPCDITDVSKLKSSRNTFASGFPKDLRKNACGYSDLRNELLHCSLWYDTAVISPDEPEELSDFYEKISDYWLKIKSAHKYSNKPIRFNAG